MSVGGACVGSGQDLVVMSLPSVQRFIAEARSTSDVAAASAIYSALAEEVVREFQTGGELVFPVVGRPGSPRVADEQAPGMPNRVVALFQEGTGAAAASAAGMAVHNAWQDWLRRALGLRDGETVPATPGIPNVQWVCVPPEPDGYRAQWDAAQRLLAARRRVRDFAPVPDGGWQRRALCSLSPRWPAEPKAPPRTPRHDREAKFSAVGWVKRSWRRVNDGDGFPSTASIASALYRQAILRRLGDRDIEAALGALAEVALVIDAPPETPVGGLHSLIPASGPGHWLGVSGGPWVYPERWQPESLARETPLADRAQLLKAAEAGARAARDLRDAMAKHGAPLTSYLAVVVQDLDNMGLFLGGQARNSEGGKIEVIPNEHRRLSRALVSLSGRQGRLLRDQELLGVPVYAGGDDLLAFTPAATALRAAEQANRAMPAELPTASTAVLFFHYHASIQRAMSTARHLLEEAKDRVRGKHALAVGYLRRSGVSEVSIQPWQGRDGESTAALFGMFAKDSGYRISPRLAADLERDAAELDRLRAASERLYGAELARLVRRHTSTRPGDGDRNGGDPHARPRDAQRTAAEAARRAASALDWLGRHECAPADPRGDVPGPHVAARVGVFLRQEAAGSAAAAPGWATR